MIDTKQEHQLFSEPLRALQRHLRSCDVDEDSGLWEQVCYGAIRLQISGGSKLSVPTNTGLHLAMPPWSMASDEQVLGSESSG
jgi:hypothetical protein